MQRASLEGLPVNAALPDLIEALREGNRAVLVAPPGAGKTTRVPLALLDEPWAANARIVVLEPRRLAARSAATHVASLLGERPGGTVGYRVRMEALSGKSTRIEFVTEGVFTRMVLDRPELPGVAAVLFDEFHERSLEGDLGLALCLDVQSALRPDLRILPMSATIDGAAVSGLLDDCPVIESHGRAFPVETRYQPKDPEERIEAAMERAIRQALAREPGSLLCFLPGQAEILRVAGNLAEVVGGEVEICPLYGAMQPGEQDRAIRPAAIGRRKIVLATSIAETSITIEGIRVVIDSGLSRAPRFEPGIGLSRLVTVRASRASVDQRAGRAGRTGPGIAIRLWSEGQTASLPAQNRPEILETDLSGLVLDLASWGVTDPGSLKWMDPPPRPAWSEAVEVLRELGALDTRGMITAEGSAMQRLPLPPRLARMVHEAGRHGQAGDAALMAVLIGERGLGGPSEDLSLRLERLRQDRGERAGKARALAARMAAGAASPSQGSPALLSPGGLLSLAYPDRIAKNVSEGPSGQRVFHLANGRRAFVDGASLLARCPFLVAADIQGSAASARIVSAAAIEETEIRLLHGARIAGRREVTLAPDRKKLQARETLRLGAILLSASPVRIEPSDRPAERLLETLQAFGSTELLSILPFGPKASLLLARLEFLHRHLPDRFPDVAPASLLARIDDWLAPMLTPDIAAFDSITDETLCEGLVHFAGVSRGVIDHLAPSHFQTPAGSRAALRYEEGAAVLAVRVQELFGLKSHPAVLDGRVAIRIELLSPAMRPVQTTMDLPGFWAGSWRDVRVEMRGRYPKHVWPEDPANAAPTLRARPRNG